MKSEKAGTVLAVTTGIEQLDEKPKLKAKDKQVGGSHYKTLAIQPVEYIHRNGIGFCEGCAIKYLTRWRSKGNGIQDLEKAKHFIDLLIEMEANKNPTF